MHIVGTAADESFLGTEFNKTIKGGGGSGTIAAGAGNDIVTLAPKFTGGRLDASGRFSVDGGAGTDTLDLTAFHFDGALPSGGVGEIGFDLTVDSRAGAVSAATDTGVVPLGTATGFEVVLLRRATTGSSARMPLRRSTEAPATRAFRAADVTPISHPVVAGVGG